ncbi:MAG: DUF4272 domain-containing protein [Fimbriimonas sp.]|nr:DUF4272 domain-containing protein [Fimbriimonas sp.]
MVTDEERERQCLARKSRSEQILRDAGILQIRALPGIETADQVEPRATIEIARRAICLLLVAARGSGLDVRTVRKLTAYHEMGGFFTKDEQAFLDSKRPKERAKAKFSWRTEASWVLLWALGFVDRLGLPSGQIEPWSAIEIVEANFVDGLVNNAKPRSIDEILDEADLIYRCHWAVRHAERSDVDIEGKLEPGVTFERHHALNWLIRYENQDWDDISTDT